MKRNKSKLYMSIIIGISIYFINGCCSYKENNSIQPVKNPTNNVSNDEYIPWWLDSEKGPVINEYKF